MPQWTPPRMGHGVANRDGGSEWTPPPVALPRFVDLERWSSARLVQGTPCPPMQVVPGQTQTRETHPHPHQPRRAVLANAGSQGEAEEALADKGVDKEEERTKIVNWLSPINFFLRHAAISEMREKGTGEWLLKHPLFGEWKSGLGNTLWCHGIPGAGKTVLISMVVNYLGTQSKGQNTGVACIYLNHKEIDDQTPSRLLAGLWRQLILDRDIGPIAERLYKQHRGKGTAPSLEEVVNVLNSSLEEFSQVFIIVDAMDECPDFQRKVLLKQLAALGSNVNLMITSRPNISADSSSFSNLVVLDIQAAAGDIQAYINAQIESSPYLPKHIQRRPELREEILTKVIDTADGMFLLAKLYMQFLSTKNTIGDVRRALKEAPKDLYDSYHLAMQQIEAQNEDNRKTARSTLIWVANAKRLLTVSELTTALAIKPGARCLDEDYLLNIETVLAVCAGLVIVDKESSVVRLVHYTTQQYLDSIQAVLFPDAQTEITHTLLTFLAFDKYPHTYWKPWDLPPLAEYSQYCLAHAAGQPEAQLREILLKFLDGAFQWIDRMNGRYQMWNSMPWNYADFPWKPSALWIAVATGLVETTRLLLEVGPLQQNSVDRDIIVASHYGHEVIVSLLLEKGADVNAAGGLYGSTLQAAIAEGHPEIVDILLEKGADVNAVGGHYGSALHAAAYNGHTEIVDILLKQGADVNATGGWDGSALQAAAAEGHTKIVSLLLEEGADVNAAGGYFGSGLQVAAYNGHTKIVDILVEKGADVNGERGFYGSALQAATAYGHIEIVEILLEKGADVNVADGRNGSILQAAAAGGYTKIVSMLLEKGADVNAVGGYYGNALQAAAHRGHTKVVDILLEKGADVNAAGGYYGSALQAAVARDYTKIVNILLENGADINAVGGEYGSALQAAATWGHTEIVDILLKKGADVNAAGGYYGSTLQAAAAEGHTELVDILLEKGADVNAAQGYYGSVLQAAAAEGYTEIVETLLKKGADINAAGGGYGSALQAAAARGHTKTVNILLEKGADVNVGGGEHGSALQAAITEDYPRIVSMLREKATPDDAAAHGCRRAVPFDAHRWVRCPFASASTNAELYGGGGVQGGIEDNYVPRRLSLSLRRIPSYAPPPPSTTAFAAAHARCHGGLPHAWTHTWIPPSSFARGRDSAALMVEKICKMICYLVCANVHLILHRFVHWLLLKFLDFDEWWRGGWWCGGEWEEDDVYFTRVLFFKAFVRRARLWLGAVGVPTSTPPLCFRPGTFFVRRFFQVFAFRGLYLYFARWRPSRASSRCTTSTALYYIHRNLATPAQPRSEFLVCVAGLAMGTSIWMLGWEGRVKAVGESAVWRSALWMHLARVGALAAHDRCVGVGVACAFARLWACGRFADAHDLWMLGRRVRGGLQMWARLCLRDARCACADGREVFCVSGGSLFMMHVEHVWGGAQLARWALTLTLGVDTYTNATWAAVALIPLAQIDNGARVFRGCDYSGWWARARGLSGGTRAAVAAGSTHTHIPRPRTTSLPTRPCTIGIRRRADSSGFDDAQTDAGAATTRTLEGGAGATIEAADESTRITLLRTLTTTSGKRASGRTGRGSGGRGNVRKPARRRGVNAEQRRPSPGWYHPPPHAHGGQNPFAVLRAAGNRYPPQQQQQQVYAPPAHGQRPASSFGVYVVDAAACVQQRQLRLYVQGHILCDLVGNLHLRQQLVRRGTARIPER
ncbi:ankyrin repeat-containing domain protein [Mycena metata]|uniref:Ankyrin repeat-containing domain protein n=1 Tax=Mycena metata TaxID=1033252 RepID=A0AAD7IFT7_9AGAR|nr:ankyrin repeat-containing domain protein [Mycena metata]